MAGRVRPSVKYTRASSIEVKLIERREQVPRRREWNNLVARNETNSILQTHEWFDAWWQTFGEGRTQLFFLLLRREGQITGFGALMLRKVSWTRPTAGGRWSAPAMPIIRISYSPYDKPAARLSIM